MKKRKGPGILRIVGWVLVVAVLLILYELAVEKGIIPAHFVRDKIGGALDDLGLTGFFEQVLGWIYFGLFALFVYFLYQIGVLVPMIKGLFNLIGGLINQARNGDVQPRSQGRTRDDNERY